MTLNGGLKRHPRPGDERMRSKSSVLLKRVKGMKELEVNQ